MVSPMLRRRPSRFVLLLAAAVVLFPDELYSVSAADVPVTGALMDKLIDNSIATNVTPHQASQQKQGAEAHAPIIDDLVALYNADVVDKKNSKGVQKNDTENFNKKGIKMKKKHKPIENGNKEGKQEERPQQPQQDVDEYLADLWKGIVHLGQDPTIQAGISALTTATHSSSQSRRQRNERRDFTQNDRRQTMTDLENDEVVAATKKPRKQNTAGSYSGAGLNQKATMSKNQRNEEYLGASRKMNPSTRPAAHQLLKKRQTLNQRGATVPLGPWMAPDYEDWNDLFDAENVINIEGVKEDKDDKQMKKQKNIDYKQQNINAKQEHQRQQQQDDMALRDEELNIDGENEEQGNKKENRKEKKKDKDQQDDEYLEPAADDTFVGYDNDDFEVNALNDADQKKNRKDKKIKKDKKLKNKIDNHNKHNGLHDVLQKGREQRKQQHNQPVVVTQMENSVGDNVEDVLDGDRLSDPVAAGAPAPAAAPDAAPAPAQAQDPQGQAPASAPASAPVPAPAPVQDEVPAPAPAPAQGQAPDPVPAPAQGQGPSLAPTPGQGQQRPQPVAGGGAPTGAAPGAGAGTSKDAGTGGYGTVPMFGPAQLDLGSDARTLFSATSMWKAVAAVCVTITATALSL